MHQKKKGKIKNNTGKTGRSGMNLYTEMGGYEFWSKNCDIAPHIRTKIHIGNVKIYLFRLSKLISISHMQHYLG